jgi:ubiquitin-protein ligase
MSVRLRRLQSEYERLKFLFGGHERIRIIEAIGRPPERYIVEFRVRGLVEEAGQIIERDTHSAEITLGPDFPRRMPRCVMLSPVFHPNIDHLAICTEDIGSAGQKLDRTIIFIGEMISFQAYNLQSPRNGDAARWTRENAGRLPLETVDLFPPLLMDTSVEMSIAVKAAGETALIERELARKCTNCGSPAGSAGPCPTGHDVCDDCRLDCRNCGTSMCLACEPRRCSSCKHLFCNDCAVACRRCGSWACLSHMSQSCPSCSAATAPQAARYLDRL